MFGLSGRGFLGRFIVEEAIKSGIEVTLFNRGKTNPELFPEVETIIGDRDGGLDGLKGGQWDAVIDTSGYFPRVVAQSAKLLSENVGHYTFISSLSVYKDFSKPGLREDAPLATLKDPSAEEITEETFGGLKALCEEVVQEEFPGNSLIIRPGLIVGPFDGSDRFTYWVHRVGKGGQMLAPGSGSSPIQFIDIEDLARWILNMAEAAKTGVFNATGPQKALTMRTLLETCKSSLKSNVKLIWVGDSFFEKGELRDWSVLPLCIPDTDSHMFGFFQINCDKAYSSGLNLTPVNETIVRTYEWSQSRADDYEWIAGMSKERESEIIKQWLKRN